ncbi:glycosyltransferase family 4 protein [Microbacterium sp. NPDC057659]|uniref:glycosyltransferase family 4 protein n=1 Tax=Microbacterium sp. NPDC057659 TaxID=3346198 RepID=UPI00366D022E
MSPRILIASRLFPPEVSAGAFRLGALARALVRRGDAVRVLTTVPPSHAPVIPDPEGVRVDRRPVLRDGGGNVRGYVQYASYDVPLAFRMLRGRYDVAVAESPPTTGLVVWVMSALKRRPVVYYAADVWTDGVISMGAPAPVVWLMRAMERLLLARAARVISVSAEVTERLVALGADPERIATVGNGIDTGVFSPDVASPDTEDDYFVYTGTMSEWQRPSVFIEALALIAGESDVKIRFFGQGSVEADLRELADRIAPGRVEFGGVVGPAESARWIRGAAGALVSIVPGIGYDFAKPTKTYAAAAVGTPVLFAGAGAGSDLVRDSGLGYAVRFDAEAVAEGMRQLLRDREAGVTELRRAERADWARTNVSLDAVADRVAEAVHDAIGRR